MTLKGPSGIWGQENITLYFTLNPTKFLLAQNPVTHMEESPINSFAGPGCG